ncbi:unnamed protein product [Acanthoscelides obtectus]|uniref:Uncharacterized protein n=1 Tax=Acanthoscelides obtectus TaxID=200917 RepID=A0A9P0VTR5_ACAOB|nr:unnamed protein product [Acanthoscelides obtectus]CAK1682709.1 hypothetical protein AOBTE_LOCUS33814 [Acanthoscelides obtectus]
MASGRVSDSVNFADPYFEAMVMRMLESLDSDVDMSDQHEDYVEESEHDTDSELDLEPNEEFDQSNNQSVQVSDNYSSDNENPNYYYVCAWNYVFNENTLQCDYHMKLRSSIARALGNQDVPLQEDHGVYRLARNEIKTYHICPPKRKRKTV